MSVSTSNKADKPSSKAKIFISYSRHDVKIIQPYTDYLARLGYEILLDSNIQAGSGFDQALMQALNEADGVLVFLTENGIKSPNVVSELGMALQNYDRRTDRKFLIPLVSSIVEVPYIINHIVSLELEEAPVENVKIIDQMIKEFMEIHPSPESGNTSPEAVIARKYSDQLNELIQQEPRWWNEVAKGLIGDYWEEVQTSLKLAELIFNAPVNDIKTDIFFNSVAEFQYSLNNVINFPRNISNSAIIDTKSHKHILYITATAQVAHEELRGLQSFIQQEKKPEEKGKTCWILKLNDRNWDINELKNETEIYFHSHTDDEVKRVGYDSFQRIKKGDVVLGYGYGTINAIVCKFEVTDELNQNPSHGEIIDLRITEILKEQISVSFLSDKISFANELSGQSGKKLFPFPVEVYNTLFPNDPLEKNEGHARSPELKSRLHSDEYALDDEDILGYDLHASNLFTIMTDSQTNPPLNIGILAPWGRGKTSLMRKVENMFVKERQKILNDKKTETLPRPTIKDLKKWLNNDYVFPVDKIPYATVWFNPWNYQSSDMIWAGMANAIVEQVAEQMPNETAKETFWFQLRLARIDKQELRKELQIRATLFFMQFFVWGIAFILTLAM